MKKLFKKKEYQPKDFNSAEITGIRPTVETLLGLKTTRAADFDVKPVERVLTLAKLKFGERKERVIDCDRVFLYHPDAVAQWLVEKRISIFRPVTSRTDLTADMLASYPPLTSVCLASMYSGMQPEQHGITSDVKKELQVSTVFDGLAEAGLKVAVVCMTGDCMAEIFRGSSIDFYIYDKLEYCNMKALELIEEDRHDMIVLYNGNYGEAMRRKGPESRQALQALRENVAAFSQIHGAIEKHWQGHNTVLAFAPDHGCHRRLLRGGDQGRSIPEDMNIRHFYSFICKK